MIAIGFDTETHLIAPGRLAPPVVCLTLAGRGAPPPWVPAPGLDVILTVDPPGPDAAWSLLATRRAIASTWRAALREAVEGRALLVAHNAAFDLAVLTDAGEVGARYAAPDTLADVFAALDRAGPAPVDPFAVSGITDTAIREKLIAIALDRFEFDRRTGRPASFSLAALVDAYFGIDLSDVKARPDAWRLRYAELDGIPAARWPAEAVAYAVDDAVYALAVREAQGDPVALDVADGTVATLVDEAGIVADEAAQVRGAWALHLASVHGLRVDGRAAREFEARVRADVARSIEVGQRAGILRPPSGWRTREGTCRPPPKGEGCGRSAPRGERCPWCGYAGKVTLDTAALRARVEAAFVALDRDVPETDGGAVATDRRTLIKASAADPILREYADLGPSKKLLSTYVPILHRAAGGGVINHGFSPLVRSGRTAAYDPNTQNPPRSGGFRECFVPRDGFAFVSVDYDIAELKGLAQVQTWLFGASDLADVINAGEDPHLSFGAYLLASKWGRPVTYAEIKAIPKDKAHPLYLDVHGPMGARQLGKIANFGFPGGLGSGSFVEYAAGYGIELTPDESAELKDAWTLRFSQMPYYFDHVARLTEGGDGVIVAPVSGRIRGGVGFTNGCNGYFQGIVADFAKASLYEVTRRAYVGDPGDPLAPDDHGPRVRPVLFVHDEIIAEVRLGPGFTEAADEVARVMVEIEGRYLPDVTPSAGPAAMPRWYKGAVEVRDDRGRLLVWTPDGTTGADDDPDLDPDDLDPEGA